MPKEKLQMTRATLIVGCLLIAHSAGGVEVVLRSHAVPRGSVVRLGDVAEITAADSATVEHLAATPLTPAPMAGTTQFLRNTELRDILRSRGLDVRSLLLSGADVVTIEPATANLASEPSTPATPSEVAALMVTPEQVTAAVSQYVRDQTGHELWNVQVDADDEVLGAFQAGASQVKLSGGKAPWTGRQRFVISGPVGTPDVTVYARIERLEMAAFAVRAIERGEFIRRADVELRPHGGALPKQSIAALDAIIGKEAVQGIRADSLLLTNQVRSPLIVHRGERVSIRVRAAGVTVRTYAVAQQDGSLGDLVTVQSLEGKERYAARVSGMRELEIFAAGATAVDVAAAPSPQVR
jgi:flagella basal body P-ring formation protein FlgA